MLRLTHIPDEWETQTYYEILGVAPTAKLREIRRAFRRLSKLHHPDRGGDPARFRKLTEIYEILCDPEARFAYDTLGLDALQLGKLIQRVTDCLMVAHQNGKLTSRTVRHVVRTISQKALEAVEAKIAENRGVEQKFAQVRDRLLPGNFVMRRCREQAELEILQLRESAAKLEQDAEQWRLVQRVIKYIDVRDAPGPC